MRSKWTRVAVSMLFLELGFGFGSWAVRIPDIQERLGLSKAALGMALLALAVGSLLGMPLASALAARVNGASLARGCALSFAACLALPALAPSLASLCATLAVMGAANGALGVVMNAQASLVERHTGRAVLSTCHGVFSVGGLTGSLSAGWLAGQAVPAMLHLPVVAAALVGLALLGAPHLVPTVPVVGAAAFARPTRGLIVFGVLAFCVLLCEGAVTDWSAVYLREQLAASPAAAAVGYSAFAVAMAIGRLSGDRLTSAWGRRRLVRIAGAVATCGAAAILIAPVLWLGLAGFALLGVGLSVAFPNVLGAAAEEDPRRVDASIAAVSTVGYLGFLLGPPLIGLLAQAIGLRGGLSPLLVCAACVLLLAGTLRTTRSATEHRRADGTPAQVGGRTR
ncbi:MAG TPA: MFS transporter [Actinophytocola sp.]|uniref:MFS transporter n=1 Tax=Actinophytocola sp. TaxID=1872138 RepID=UPI002DDD043C|nr:MFS transporter [Actinophytocola sp.]HEV2778656.1 MFS transporter [Actinophytocola sp.]